MRCIVMRGKTLMIAAVILAILVGIFFMRGGAIIAVLSQSRALPIYSVARDEKVVALTFDTSWGDNTAKLMRILDQYNVRATFFVTGDWVDRHGNSVKALHTGGHEVMNHSNTHPHMTKMSSEDIKKDVSSCNEKIERLIGIRPTLFRPPYGDYDDRVIRTLESMQMFTVNWDVDSLDWKNLATAEIKKGIMTRIRPGSIVLFHCTARHTEKALPEVIEALMADGYRILPVSQILYKENYTIDHTGRQRATS